jgi:hypothetical protein
VGVGDGFCGGMGVDARCESMSCIAPVLPHRAMTASRTATCTNRRRDVNVVLLTIAITAVQGLCTFHSGALFHLLRLTPCVFPGGSFQRQPAGLIDK